MNHLDFFHHLWDDYARIAPQARRLRELLEERGETVVNDHIAFRTFDRSPIGLEALERHVLALGYRRLEAYAFPDKKLRAFGYVCGSAPDSTGENEGGLSPSAVHPGAPRIFLSELETSHFSARLQADVQALCDQVDPARVERPDVLWAGTPWRPVAWEVYQRLLEESEYAGWVAALGLRANHFTVSVNELRTFADFPAFLDWVESHGFALNQAGGRLKGTPEVLLEQASTLADRQPVEFADGRKETVPTCYYEFAKRYPQPDGELYQGFVAASADKIFESTDSRR